MEVMNEEATRNDAFGNVGACGADRLVDNDGFLRDRVLIIGQAPARDTVGKPAFSGKSGPKFAELLGVEHPELWQKFEVVNLLNYFPGDPKDRTKRGDAFPICAAKVEAMRMIESLTRRTVVMVGKNVARAFGWPVVEFFRWYVDATGPKDDSFFKFCVVPHPSGVSHFWNDPIHVEEAKKFMRTIPR